MFPITIHPDVAGRPQVLLMLERLFRHMIGHPGVRFMTLEAIAEDFARRSPRKKIDAPVFSLPCKGRVARRARRGGRGEAESHRPPPGLLREATSPFRGKVKPCAGCAACSTTAAAGSMRRQRSTRPRSGASGCAASPSSGACWRPPASASTTGKARASWCAARPARSRSSTTCTISGARPRRCPAGGSIRCAAASHGGLRPASRG